LISTTFLNRAGKSDSQHPIFATEQSQAKHAGNIKKRQAEQIALSRIRGGTIRSAELQAANGSHFWAVFVAKPDKINAKEVHIDATNVTRLLEKVFERIVASLEPQQALKDH
jgi:uncharacterized membrane protein YkoI